MTLWDEESELYLFTVDELAQIPDGTTLTCIDNTTAVKGRDIIDTDTICNMIHIAYGVVDPWSHPLKDLFLIFKLRQ